MPKKIKIWLTVILALVGLAITVPNAVKLTKVGYNLHKITTDTSAKIYAVDQETADRVSTEAQKKRDVYYEHSDKEIREFSNSPWKLFILAWKWLIIAILIITPTGYLLSELSNISFKEFFQKFWKIMTLS